MSTQDIKADPMQGRIARWGDIQAKGIPVMFIDSVLPGHYRMNYSVVGDTASENPDYEVAIAAPHKFQIGMFEAPPGNGPGWHTHTYVEMFMPLTGTLAHDRTPVILGGNGNDDSGVPTELFPGRIDELMLFGRALAADEIAQLAAGAAFPAAATDAGTD